MKYWRSRLRLNCWCSGITLIAVVIESCSCEVVQATDSAANLDRETVRPGGSSHSYGMVSREDDGVDVSRLDELSN